MGSDTGLVEKVRRVGERVGYSLDFAIVFGSRSGSGFDEDSDLDVLVVRVSSGVPDLRGVLILIVVEGYWVLVSFY